MEFIPKRMKLAMFLKNETVTSLAVKTGLSKQSISKFKDGELMPSKRAMILLKVILDFPENFFSCTYINIYEDHFGYEIKCATGEKITIPYKNKNGRV